MQKQAISIQKQSTQQQNEFLSRLKMEIKQKSTQINTLLAQNQVNDIHVNKKIKQLIILQAKFHNVKDLFLAQDHDNKKQQLKFKEQSNFNNQQQQQQSKQQSKKQKQQQQQKKKSTSFHLQVQQIQKQSQLLQPTIEQIQQRRNLFLQQNMDGWTDATQSQTGTMDPDNIMVFDDDMLDQICGKIGENQQDSNQQQEDEKVNLEELQDQFVIGGQSDEHIKLGKHKDNKFCVSVAASLKDGIVVSGGGDDYMNVYKFDTKEVQSKLEQQYKQLKKLKQQKQQKKQKQQNQAKQQHNPITIQPVTQILHHQTVNLIDFSFDRQLVFSLSQKQLMATSTSTFQPTKLQLDPPTSFSCHKYGGVFSTFSSFNLQIYNIKGLKFYDSYCLDEQISLMKWTLNGKQLIVACDNKLRIITPKTREIIKVTGTQFHQGEITALAMSDSTIFSGCIDGMVFASNINKGHILCGSDKMQATINTLSVAENYLIVGPAINKIYWYDTNKLKRLFQTQLKGNSTDIIQLHNKNYYAVSDIQGGISLFDKRCPMQIKNGLKAGNTVHQMYYEDSYLFAACEDGNVRGWDLRRCKYY